jgi:hypothetical protein
MILVSSPWVQFWCFVHFNENYLTFYELMLYEFYNELSDSHIPVIMTMLLK